MRLNNLMEVDVLIAGAGPAGLAFASRLSGYGLSMMIVESRHEIGKPLRCVEVTRPEYFNLMGVEPRKQWIRWELKDTPEKFLVLNRPRMESDMAGMLLRKGVHILRDTSVTGVGNYNGTGRLIRLSGLHSETSVFAKLVVASDGISSQVARMAGIHTQLTSKEILSCISFTCGNVRLKHKYRPATEFPEYLKPGFIWVVPTGVNEANIGLSISGTDGSRSMSVLAAYMKSEPGIARARIRSQIVGCYPYSMPLENPSADGLMVAGTAARLVDASNGEGIIYAACSGQIAAQTFISRQFDTSAGSLYDYRNRLEPMFEALRNIYLSTQTN
jgi:digeranylgeranylglycerophospholipid reductase